MTSLVSVLMPLFNSADTVSLALASLQAQTYQNWECIIVDDGSTDNLSAVIENVQDARIHFHRLSRNRGRGYARQHALENAQGNYLAFLDGDDWIYPTKLKQQVELLASQSDVAIVSTGMAISNREGELTGIRTCLDKSGAKTAFRRPAMPPLAFAPSMMKAELARQTGFDRSFPTCEDVDFLLRAVLGKLYAVLPAALYVYREQGSTTLAKVHPALNYSCEMFMKHFRDFPGSCAIEIVKARGKQAVYHAASALGFWEQIIARRSRPASETEREQYEDALRIVKQVAHQAELRRDAKPSETRDLAFTSNDYSFSAPGTVAEQVGARPTLRDTSIGT
jgi:glycosyltransferase involved in cell wall biosynthesis